MWKENNQSSFSLQSLLEGRQKNNSLTEKGIKKNKWKMIIKVIIIGIILLLLMIFIGFWKIVFALLVVVGGYFLIRFLVKRFVNKDG